MLYRTVRDHTFVTEK